ncbi:MAG: hypothetical protein D6776_02490 [Planctomycetota bacterium]|nr:MAG: hypothetical protein D6776_02490 [Planctomycetota bacterium]
MWSGNRWDDYRGYDLDGDGFGDVPYELRSLSGELTAKHPELRLLAGTPALALIDVAAHAMPLLQPRLILRDPHPRMGLDDPVREERRGGD